MAWEIVKAFFIILGILMAIGLAFQIILNLFIGTKTIGKAIIGLPKFLVLELPSIIRLIPSKINKENLLRLLKYTFSSPSNFFIVYLIFGLSYAFIWVVFFSWW